MCGFVFRIQRFSIFAMIFCHVQSIKQPHNSELYGITDTMRTTILRVAENSGVKNDAKIVYFTPLSVDFDNIDYNGNKIVIRDVFTLSWYDKNLALDNTSEPETTIIYPSENWPIPKISNFYGIQFAPNTPALVNFRTGLVKFTFMRRYVAWYYMKDYEHIYASTGFRILDIASKGHLVRCAQVVNNRRIVPVACAQLNGQLSVRSNVAGWSTSGTPKIRTPDHTNIIMQYLSVRYRLKRHISTQFFGLCVAPLICAGLLVCVQPLVAFTELRRVLIASFGLLLTITCVLYSASTDHVDAQPAMWISTHQTFMNLLIMQMAVVVMFIMQKYVYAKFLEGPLVYNLCLRKVGLVFTRLRVCCCKYRSDTEIISCLDNETLGFNGMDNSDTASDGSKEESNILYRVYMYMDTIIAGTFSVILIGIMINLIIGYAAVGKE